MPRVAVSFPEHHDGATALADYVVLDPPPLGEVSARSRHGRGGLHPRRLPASGDPAREALIRLATSLRIDLPPAVRDRHRRRSAASGLPGATVGSSP